MRLKSSMPELRVDTSKGVIQFSKGVYETDDMELIEELLKVPQISKDTISFEDEAPKKRQKKEE